MTSISLVPKNDEIDESLAYDIGKIKREIGKVSVSFFYIGLTLYEIKKRGEYGIYQNIYELAEAEFQFKSTLVKNLINIFLKYKCPDRFCMVMGYDRYNVSQLVEMLPLDKAFIQENINPSMTVAEIREIKKRDRASDEVLVTSPTSDCDETPIHEPASEIKDRKAVFDIGFDKTGYVYMKLMNLCKNEDVEIPDLIVNIVSNVLSGPYDIEDFV